MVGPPQKPKSNAKWDDPDQYAQLDELTTSFRTLYNDPSLATGATSNPNLSFSSTEYFADNPPPTPPFP